MKVLMHILILTLFIEERAYYYTACMEYSSFFMGYTILQS